MLPGRVRAGGGVRAAVLTQGLHLAGTTHHTAHSRTDKPGELEHGGWAGDEGGSQGQGWSEVEIIVVSQCTS